jgi:hypothetical protein
LLVPMGLEEVNFQVFNVSFCFQKNKTIISKKGRFVNYFGVL